MHTKIAALDDLQLLLRRAVTPGHMEVIELSDSEDEGKNAPRGMNRARIEAPVASANGATSSRIVAIDVEADDELMSRQILSSIGREAQARRERKARLESAEILSSDGDPMQ